MARSSKTGIRGLFRRSDGIFEIDLRWKDPHTGEQKRLRETLPKATTAVAAKERARKVLSSALAGEFKPKQEAIPALEKAFKEYIKWCDSDLPKAVKKRTSMAKRFLRAFGDVALDAVTPFHVEKFKRDRQAKGAAPATVNRDLSMLSHFYGLAVSWRWITEEKARPIRKVKHLREPPGRVRHLRESENEEGRLLAVMSKGILPIVQAALLSGMRQSEVVSLQKSAVDLSSRVITLTVTKSNKVRQIHINDELAELLKKAMAASKGSYVFTNLQGEPYTANGVRVLFGRAVEKANLEDFRFHDLRHTTATRLRQNDVGLDVIADVLGHSTLTMTRRYAHLEPTTLKTAMSKLPPLTKPETDQPEVIPIRKTKDAKK